MMATRGDWGLTVFVTSMGEGGFVADQRLKGNWKAAEAEPARRSKEVARRIVNS